MERNTSTLKNIFTRAELQALVAHFRKGIPVCRLGTVKDCFLGSISIADEKPQYFKREGANFCLFLEKLKSLSPSEVILLRCSLEFLTINKEEKALKALIEYLSE